MRKLFSQILGVIGALLILSFAVGALVSKLYWGYWFAPPSVKPWVEELRSVEAAVYLFCEPDRTARAETLSEAHLHELAAQYLEAPQHYPGNQLLAALHAAGSRVDAATPVAASVQPICDELLRSRFIVDAEPGYEYARFIRGFLVIGLRGAGDHVAILSAFGGEVSNDHHAVYDVEFVDRGPHRWSVLRHHQYFEDIAGVEGLRWFLIAAICFIAGVALTASVSLAALSARLVSRRFRARPE